MIQSIETTGKTTEDALKAALAELGLTRDEVSVEIVTMPKSGFFGIGAVPAKLRVSFDDGRPEPQAAPEREKKPAAEKKPAPARNPASEKKPAAAKAPKAKAPAAAPARAPESAARPAGSREEEAETFLRGLLERMGVECTIAIAPREGGGMDITLDGENMGAVIGRKGETLDAIQHLVNYTVNRGSDKHMHINVDAEGYRSKREETLVNLAHKMAAKVLKYKRSMAFEPMNSYERHVIHTALQDVEGVSTNSIGTEPNRRVVVNYERPAGESAEPQRRDRGRRERNRSGRSDRPAAPKPAPAEEAEERTADPVEKTAYVAPPPPPEDYTPPVKNKPQAREWC